MKQLLQGTSSEKHVEHFRIVAFPAPHFVHRLNKSQCFDFCKTP